MKFIILMLVSVAVAVYGSELDNPIDVDESRATDNPCDCGWRPSNCKADTLDRIIGGMTSTPHCWPWMVRIAPVGSTHWCGGTIIANRYILTAAQCVINYNPNRPVHYEIHVGDHNIAEPDDCYQLHTIKNVHIHEDYNDNQGPPENNIAVVEVLDDIIFSECVHAICLPTPGAPLVDGVVTGWGYTANGFPNLLHEVTVPIVPNSACLIISPTSSTICAGTSGSGFCKGDVGGPLQYDASNGIWRIIGVASQHDNYCMQKPDIYTKVVDYLAWIKTHTQPKYECVTEPPSTESPSTEPPPSDCTNWCGLSNPNTRIANGDEANDHEFPWMAHIKWSYDHGDCATTVKCGGTIINDHVVMTAARCVVKYFNEGKVKVEAITVDVCLGENLLSECDYMYEGSPYPHPDYNPVNHDNDIALIKLSSTITFDATNPTMLPICLPSTAMLDETFIDESAKAAGWGVTQNSLASNALIKVDVDVIENSECEQSYPSITTTENMMCTSNDENSGTCQDDDGGPLMVMKQMPPCENFVQIGVTSLHEGTCNEDHPDVYARVTSHMDWIKANAGQVYQYVE